MSLCGGRWWGSYGVMVSDDGICSSNGVGLFRVLLGSRVRGLICCPCPWGRGMWHCWGGGRGGYWGADK